MDIAIAVFVKTIGITPVKTRLAKDIGTAKAEEFYQLSRNATAQTVDNFRDNFKGITPYWAVAEKAASCLSCYHNFDQIWTGEGGLGERLNNVYSLLQKKHDGVILIGSDSPHLSPTILEKATNKLQKNPDKCVIGPCLDGGFYLFGSSLEIKSDIWLNVNYSTSKTLEKLTKELDENNIALDYLAKEFDVDTGSDLETLFKRMTDDYEHLLPNQEKVYLWVKQRFGC